MLVEVNGQTVKVEFSDQAGEFIAYVEGDYHTGYGATVEDAKDSLAWSMANE